MIDANILHQLKTLVPPGERSDFVNNAVEEKLTDIAQKKAFEDIAEMRRQWKWKMTAAEMRKARNYGRE